MGEDERQQARTPETVEGFEHLCREVAGTWNRAAPVTELVGNPISVALLCANGTNALGALRTARRLARLRGALLAFTGVAAIWPVIAVMASSRGRTEGTSHLPGVWVLMAAGIALVIYGGYCVVKVGAAAVDPDEVIRQVDGAAADLEDVFAAARHLGDLLVAQDRSDEVTQVREILLNLLDYEAKGLRQVLERDRVPEERQLRDMRKHADLTLLRKANIVEDLLVARSHGVRPSDR